MPSPQKRKGDEFERTVCDYLRHNGFPYAERTRAGYQRDTADIHLDPTVGLAPGAIGQAKKVRTPRWREWITDLREQINNARADVGFLIWKLWGVGDPGEQLAIMPLREYVVLLRRAGYGTPLQWHEQCENCGASITWIACPTGGWWTHDNHPADNHDAITQVQPPEDVDDRGHWITPRNLKGVVAHRAEQV
ncbi:hypothetical protein [Nocardia panacis]|uniref:hypothetical protein n=1 Tax=Nocardia panacis TaxID=2340916 RepID=UPI001939BF4A|nr:hypothetical protein [Nocardia panacis]